MTAQPRQRGVRTVEYSCGHKGREDLSELSTERRASRVAWIKENKTCRACWEESVGYVSREQREKQLQDEEASKGWRALAGTIKQVSWAMQIRHDKLAEIYELLVVENSSHSEQEFIDEVEAPAGQIVEAKFWIDNRELSPELLADEISQYESDDESQGCENPY